jgi:integrase
MASRKQEDKFPLWVHPTGQYAKKIHGRYYYFGKDRDKALKEYLRVREDLEAGREPRPTDDETRTVADVVNSFLTEKRGRVEAGELSARTWSDYSAACEAVVDAFGRSRAVSDLRPDDFAKLRSSVAGRLGPVSVLNFVTRVRVLFKHAYDFGLIDTPVRYGSGFDRPAKKTLRLERAKKGAKLTPPADLWKLLGAADVQLRAMMLLALNGGMGSTDCAGLARSAVELRPGWIDYPRVKTGTARRFPLWPETAEAIAAVTSVRPDPRNPADDRLVFLTRLGRPWVRFHGDEKGKRSVIDAVAQQFAKLGRACELKLPGGFYVLRHVHRTVSDEARDRPAADLVMGHTDPSVTGYDREVIADDRLAAVVGHVRGWLLAGRKTGPEASAK